MVHKNPGRIRKRARGCRAAAACGAGWRRGALKSIPRTPHRACAGWGRAASVAGQAQSGGQGDGGRAPCVGWCGRERHGTSTPSLRTRARAALRGFSAAAAHAHGSVRRQWTTEPGTENEPTGQTAWWRADCVGERRADACRARRQQVDGGGRRSRGAEGGAGTRRPARTADRACTSAVDSAHARADSAGGLRAKRTRRAPRTGPGVVRGMARVVCKWHGWGRAASGGRRWLYGAWAACTWRGEREDDGGELRWRAVGFSKNQQKKRVSVTRDRD